MWVVWCCRPWAVLERGGANCYSGALGQLAGMALPLRTLRDGEVFSSAPHRARARPTWPSSFHQLVRDRRIPPLIPCGLVSAP